MAKERGQGGGPLADLLAYMASQKPIETAAVEQGSQASGDPAAPGKGLAEPAQLDYFRALWTDVSARRFLRQSQEQVPDNAGPLNSSHLVYRSLALMRDVSPGYLRHFLAHLEALSWMEQVAAGAETGREASRSAGARKGARGR